MTFGTGDRNTKQVEQLLTGRSMIFKFCRLYVLMLQLVLATSQAAVRPKTNHSALISKLTQDYSPNQPSQEGGRINVRVQIGLLNIVEVSTQQEFIEVHGWLRLFWNDPALTWDTEDWNIKRLAFRQDQLWVPDVTIYEQIANSREEFESVLVTVSSNGDASVSIPSVIKVGCSMNLTSYPFDTQYCGMTLGSWSWTGDDVNVLPQEVGSNFWLTSDFQRVNGTREGPGHSAFDLSEFRAKPNSAEFELRALRVMLSNKRYNYEDARYPVLELEFELQRGTGTILISLMIPMIIVTIVGFCTLMMPAPVSGARPALSVTVMLTTATVYLVASRFTPHSNTLTSLSRMYILCFSMSALLVLVSIVTTSLNLIGPDDKISDQALSDWFRHFDADNR
jgi:hypothetical protein